MIVHRDIGDKTRAIPVLMCGVETRAATGTVERIILILPNEYLRRRRDPRQCYENVKNFSNISFKIVAWRFRVVKIKC